MQAQGLTIVLQGLTHLEADELATELQRAGADPEAHLKTEAQTGGLDSEYGEPFTLLALLAVSQVTLTALALYLTKARKHQKSVIRVRHRRPDGEEMEYTIELDTSSEEATRADLVKQIAGLNVSLPASGQGDV